MSTPPLICIGHSHVGNVVEAAQRRGVPLIALDFWHLQQPVIEESGAVRLQASIVEQLRDGPVFSLIGGTAHAKLGLVVHPTRRFDFVLPSRPDLPLDGRAEIVPVDGVRAALIEIAQPYFNLMHAVRAASTGTVFHLQPPPVLADEGTIARTVPWLFYGRVRHVSPRHLRYKLWRLHSEVLDTFCREMDIVFVAHPPEAVDADGFLLPRYYKDAMHANGDYGDLVLDQMRAAA